uniref:Uncharacterized protein n=1 Tax=Anopheles dirus TaxID=7168 RepID=A0A182N6R3_9DIPT
MAKSVLGLVAVALLVQCLWCASVAVAAPNRGPVIVGGGVRPVVARPGIYRAPVLYRPPVVVRKVIQPVIVPRPVPILVG